MNETRECARSEGSVSSWGGRQLWNTSEASWARRPWADPRAGVAPRDPAFSDADSSLRGFDSEEEE